MRAATGLLSVFLLTGCACFAPAAPAASAKSDPACPSISKAEAWLNKMPGPRPRTETLVVLVQFADPSLWQLQQTGETGADGILLLELVPGGEGYRGSAGFKMPQAGRYDEIHIACSGAQAAVIRDFTSAY